MSDEGGILTRALASSWMVAFPCACLGARGGFDSTPPCPLPAARGARAPGVRHAPVSVCVCVCVCVGRCGARGGVRDGRPPCCRRCA
ncbi:hypothetical protein EON67_05405 [archaeon]|nr:MAG: hypothetical protein EON67_05405 [archaeon]